jgi:hypothetical protein
MYLRTRREPAQLMIMLTNHQNPVAMSRDAAAYTRFGNQHTGKAYRFLYRYARDRGMWFFERT